MLGEARDHLAPLAKGRDVDLDDVQAVVEVFPELAVLHRCLEIAVGGRNDADVDVDQLPSADARELEVLEDVEELRLEGTRQLPDLVEADGAAVGELELAQLPPVGARERPPLVAEELGLEQLGRQGGTVHQDERLVHSRRQRVDGPGDEVLADPALTAEQDGRVRAGDLLDEVAESLRPRAQREERKVLGERGTGRRTFVGRRLAMGGDRSKGQGWPADQPRARIRGRGSLASRAQVMR